LRPAWNSTSARCTGSSVAPRSSSRSRAVAAAGAPGKFCTALCRAVIASASSFASAYSLPASASAAACWFAGGWLSASACWSAAAAAYWPSCSSERLAARGAAHGKRCCLQRLGQRGEGVGVVLVRLERRGQFQPRFARRRPAAGEVALEGGGGVLILLEVELNLAEQEGGAQAVRCVAVEARRGAQRSDCIRRTVPAFEQAAEREVAGGRGGRIGRSGQRLVLLLGGIEVAVALGGVAGREQGGAGGRIERSERHIARG